MNERERAWTRMNEREQERTRANERGFLVPRLGDVAPPALGLPTPKFGPLEKIYARGGWGLDIGGYGNPPQGDIAGDIDCLSFVCRLSVVCLSFVCRLSVVCLSFVCRNPPGGYENPRRLSVETPLGGYRGYIGE